MSFIFVCCIVMTLISLVVKFMYDANTKLCIASIIAVFLIGSLLLLIDITSQTTATEVWSGTITSVNHTEEWDEWIPPKTETYTETDSKGKTVTKTRTIPGYWEHHYATNYINTSDDGSIYVTKTPDGKELTDYFVNSNEELAQYYPVGSPTASVHTYKNKVQASYSLYNTQDVNLKDYPNLPQYPKTVNSSYTIDRIIGDIPNKEQSLKALNELNSTLNDTNNANNKDGTKSYKQVNIIFVNMGDVTEDYGYALQNYWKNGNKNDFIVAFGTSNNEVTWCYPFSWTEVESLKSQVRDYMLDKCDLNNFTQTISDTGTMIEKKFVRKEFADFEYINIEPRAWVKIVLIIVCIISLGIIIYDIIDNNRRYKHAKSNYYRR